MQDMHLPEAQQDFTGCYVHPSEVTITVIAPRLNFHQSPPCQATLTVCVPCSGRQTRCHRFNLKTAVGQPQRAQRTQGRELEKGIAFTCQVIAPVCPTTCISLCSLRSLWSICCILVKPVGGLLKSGAPDQQSHSEYKQPAQHHLHHFGVGSGSLCALSIRATWVSPS